MNPTSSHTVQKHFRRNRTADDRTLVERLYREAGLGAAVRPPLTVARNVVAVTVAVAVVVQVVVWAAVVVGSGNAVSPWWMWSVLGGGLLVLAVAGLARRDTGRPQAERRVTRSRERTGREPAEPRMPLRRWATARRVVVPLYVLSTIAQLAVWLVHGVMSRYDSPWWTWSALPGAGLTLVVVLLARHEESQRG